MPSWPGFEDGVEVLADHEGPGSGDEAPRRAVARGGHAVIWAPVSDEPAESMMMTLGRWAMSQLA